jgi:hypothetical protein
MTILSATSFLNRSLTSLDPLAGLMNMNKNRRGVVPMPVFMFGGCSEGQFWRICWEHVLH